jgi:heme-degrading monooxygenase HmoA
MIPGAEGRSTAQAGRDAMYVRVTTMMFRLETYDQGVRIFEESVVPAARAQKGFRSAYLLGDRAQGRAMALTFWENEAAALANEENRYYQEQLVKFLPNFRSAPVREGYEVVVESR